MGEISAVALGTLGPAAEPAVSADLDSLHSANLMASWPGAE
jgi:hypothetical protein